MRLNRWNDAFHLTTVMVEEGPVPAFNPQVHEDLNRFLYTTGQGVERLDYPIMAKLKRRYFTVTASEDVGERFFQIPRETIDDLGIDAPDLCQIFIARKDNASSIASMMFR